MQEEGIINIEKGSIGFSIMFYANLLAKNLKYSTLGLKTLNSHHKTCGFWSAFN